MNAILSVRDLRKTYDTRHGPLKAVDGISFDIAPGRTLALVGESGCGKSTAALAILRLQEPTGGSVLFDGHDLATTRSGELRALRREFGIVFQNPYSSLDPKMKIRDIVGEPLVTAFGLKGRALTERVVERLTEVGLGPEHLRRYPHEFSGGQRQRIAIARALASEPRLLVLDEPTAALDVSIQAQVLNLLLDLQARHGLAYLFISHNLATVEYVADEVMIMYLGRIVERGPTAEVFAAPRHPYTRALVSSIPRLDPRRRDELQPLLGEVPSPLDMPPGCGFAPRCAFRTEACTMSQPPLDALEPNTSHAVACYHPLDTETAP
jgi:peptide/nickel transport system ATP-binding protein/oligopeptide transport system ATP-binding protein